MTPFLRLKILHCASLFFILLGASFSLLFLQTATVYISDTHSRLKFAIDMLDKQFSNVTVAVKNVLREVTEDCTENELLLSNALVNEPVIQSLVVERNREVICSTHQPNIGKINGSENIINFNLITSIIVVPGEVIAVIKYGDNNLAVAATLHGFNIFGPLALMKKDSPIHINYKGYWVNEEKKLVSYKNIDSIHLKSELFPYSISTKYSYFSILKYFLSENTVSLFLLAMFSACGAIVYWRYGNERVMIQAMKKAIVKQEFEAFAQGVTDEGKKLAGCEILIRWNSKWGVIKPDDFIPIAEKTDLIVFISAQLIKDTYDAFERSDLSFTEDFHIAFNISPEQLKSKNAQSLIDAISLFKKSDKLRKIKIVLELTERLIVVYTPEILHTIDLLKDIGVHIVIDDFGTGYSSLENIMELEVYGIKIDKRFVDKFPCDLISINLIDNMIHLAKKLDIPIVAEGVETQVQADALIDRGVNYLQGYLFYKPVPLDEFIRTKYTVNEG